MNKSIGKLSLDKLIFFDIECVRGKDTLEIDSREYDLFAHKNRDRDSGDHLPEEELQLLWKQKGALNMALNKIVCISVAAVSNNKIYIKSFTGTEEEIIAGFTETLGKGYTPVGYNINSFDFPLLRMKALRYGLHMSIPDALNDSGKKPWNMTSSIDLMDLVKGTYFYNLSLDEACYLADVPTPKDGIDGSKVSDVYYAGGIDEIAKYCEKDVIACVHLLQRMQGSELILDIQGAKERAIVEDQPLIKEFLISSDFSPKVKQHIEAVIKEQGATEEELRYLEKIILAHYQKKGDRVGVKKEKATEVKEYIDNLIQNL